MDEAQRRILQMLQDGAITAAEANRLLAAMGVAGDSVAVEEPVESVASSRVVPAAREAAPDASEASRRVLHMLQNGAITAEEANRLLAAMDDEPVSGPLASGPADEARPGTPPEPVRIGEEFAPPPAAEYIPPAGPEAGPNAAFMPMERFRRLWQLPFVVALILLVFSGLFMSATYGTFWFVCGWSVFMVAVLAVVIAYWSRTATWVHVRVREAEGKRIAISLPIPIRLAGWLLPLARRFVDEEEAAHLDAAAEFLAAMQDEMRQPGASPLVVDVSDDDGDQVQVYIG